MSYEVSARTSLAVQVTMLIGLLHGTLVAALAGSRDRRAPYRWMDPDGPTPRVATQQRIQVAYRAMMLLDSEPDGVARAWFIGANPILDESSPIWAIREGRFAEVIAAATHFVESGQ